jgi:hypothetical protein
MMGNGGTGFVDGGLGGTGSERERECIFEVGDAVVRREVIERGVGPVGKYKKQGVEVVRAVKLVCVPSKKSVTRVTMSKAAHKCGSTLEKAVKVAVREFFDLDIWMLGG